MVAHPRLRDRALRRLADLLPRQRGRRPRHGHHPRDPRRGPHRLHPPRARAAARALGGGRRPGVRAPAAHRRRRVARQALEASRRGRGRGLPHRRLPPRGAHELPRAARVGAGRRRRRGARRRRAGRRSSTSTASRTPPPAFDRDEARLAERRVDPSARRSTSSSRGSSPLARARFGDRFDRRRGRARRSRSRRSARSTLVQIVDQMAFLFVADDDFAIADRVVGEVVERPTGSARSSTR